MSVKIFRRLIISSLILCQYAFCAIDFEDLIQDFVLGTKQLCFEGFPDAFNPSIVECQDYLLMSFRFRDPLTLHANQVALVKLDENFNCLEKPVVLQQRFYRANELWMQDPRLIYLQDRLYIVFNNTAAVSCDPTIRRMCLTEIQEDDSGYFIENPQVLLNFEKENPKIHEKNWTPFVYENQLLLVYSLLPHRILAPLSNHPCCETIACTQGSITWDWGILRGGTPALLEGDHYLSFFHSCKAMASAHSEGKVRDHYFMAAYTFSKEPPFEITSISPEPIVGRSFYHGKKHKTWKPLHAIFPGGYISNEHFIWVVYGRQDHEAWVVKLDKKRLLNSLTKVNTL